MKEYISKHVTCEETRQCQCEGILDNVTCEGTQSHVRRQDSVTCEGTQSHMRRQDSVTYEGTQKTSMSHVSRQEGIQDNITCEGIQVNVNVKEFKTMSHGKEFRRDKHVSCEETRQFLIKWNSR